MTQGSSCATRSPGSTCRRGCSTTGGCGERARADRGVRLLFTGPPGTGKSLAAEVVATEAATDLLVVDVSRVVSKWLGETEKNLAAAFDVAQRTQAVLFLDEADVTFGTRTEISDAQDRYANLETAYLLQRLDSFDGLAVLATNLRQNIDAAFVRRMDFVIDFPLPDEAVPAGLWKLHLPPERLVRVSTWPPWPGATRCRAGGSVTPRSARRSWPPGTGGRSCRPSGGGDGPRVRQGAAAASRRPDARESHPSTRRAERMLADWATALAATAPAATAQEEER